MMKRGLTLEINSLVSFWEVTISNGRMQGEPRLVATGFVFMYPNVIATAKHVAELIFDCHKPVFPLVGQKDGIGSHAALPTKYWLDSERDIALLEYEADDYFVERPFYPSHFGISNDPELLALAIDTGECEASPPRIVYHPHRVKRWEREERERSESEFCITFEADWVKGGCSGGPLLDWRGGVVGVITNSFSRDINSVEPTHGRATSIYPAVRQFQFVGSTIPQSTYMEEGEIG